MENNRNQRRTWEEFVEELIGHRTVNQICAIAVACRWRANLSEIRIHAKNLRKIIKYKEKPQVSSSMGYNIDSSSKKIFSKPFIGKDKK